MKEKLNKILFGCDDTRIIEIEPYEGVARFSTVKKYELLYKEELKRFKKSPKKIYALPYEKNPSRIYNGLDRKGLMIIDKLKKNLNDTQKTMVNHVLNDPILSAEDVMVSEVDAKLFLSCFANAEDYELIWSRISGSTERVPEGYAFIGYDITYLPDDDGAFSMINDCMFICRWHGCDEEGTLFVDDFARLNSNGLFDTFSDAYDYMIKYLKEDWTETGIYGIFEIYTKRI